MTPQQIEQMRINSCRKGLTMYGEYVAGAMDASEWQRKHDIDKACRWLRKHLPRKSTSFFREFRKAMEEEQ